MIPLPCSTERIIDSLFTAELCWSIRVVCNDENQFPLLLSSLSTVCFGKIWPSKGFIRLEIMHMQELQETSYEKSCELILQQNMLNILSSLEKALPFSSNICKNSLKCHKASQMKSLQSKSSCSIPLLIDFVKKL